MQARNANQIDCLPHTQLTLHSSNLFLPNRLEPTKILSVRDERHFRCADFLALYENTPYVRRRGNDMISHRAAVLLQAKIYPSFDWILDSVKRIGMMPRQDSGPSKQPSRGHSDQRWSKKMCMHYIYVVLTNNLH